MGDSHSWKPGSRPGSSPSPAKPVADDSRGNTAGRIVHDERGNAVWDWLKDTARTAIDSTSRLLRKLEVPELKMEDTQSQELRLESDRDQGGGYDPYGGAGPTSGHASGDKSGGGYDPYGGSGPTSGRTSGNARAGAGGIGTNRSGGHDPYGRSPNPSSGANKNIGGGYDPYGKGVTSKPTRKP